MTQSYRVIVKQKTKQDKAETKRPWGDFVDRRFLERGFGINQIYFFFSMNLRNLHDTQEAGKW
jgi:hypothetical protein